MVALVSAVRPDSCVVAEFRPSPNHGERKNDAKIGMIVLHYTGMSDTEAALRKLCTAGSEVSSHYFVMEDGYIAQCVPEARRAWHAGVASWGGQTDINSFSIGIEIANPGLSHGYPDFPRRQIAAVIALCRSILTRHKIPPYGVLAHSDVAPSRKQDPGEKFPWQRLHESGIGLWIKPAPLNQAGKTLVLGDLDPAVGELQAMLAQYGYAVPTSGYLDGATRDVIVAFQRHFRPERVNGEADPSTIATLRALVAARDAA